MTDSDPVTRSETQPAYQSELGGPPPRRADPWTVILGILGGVLLGTGVTFAILGVTGVFEEPTPPTIPPPPTVTAPPPTGAPPTLGGSVTAAQVAARVIPSIVAVDVSSLLSAGSGSGVVYGSDGYIITNNHVIDRASEISVTFADGARFTATLIGADPQTDLAVLLVQRPDLAPISLGSSDTLVIGEPAIAVGNPLRLQGGPTVTAGIVSALNRTLTTDTGNPLYGLVQTDAPIAPGSSGGALVNARGELIGITTAIAVSEVGAEGLGFAVPVDLAVGVVNDLILNGEVAHAFLGIRGATVWAASSGAEYPVGIGVTDLVGDSAYQNAGGQVNDVIYQVGEYEVNTITDLLAALRRFRAGETVPLRILRTDADLILDVEMGLLQS